MAKKNDGRVNEVRRIFQKLYPNATSNTWVIDGLAASRV